MSFKQLTIFFLLLSVHYGLPDVIQTHGVEAEADSNIKFTHLRVLETLFGLIEEEFDPDWNLLEDVDQFKEDEAVEDFVNILNEGMLAKGETFNMQDPKIKDETIKLFDLLYFAKDFDTMIKVAIWVRPKVNYEQFVYALSMALNWRSDVKVELPPWYEIFPNYFIPAENLAKLKQAKARGEEEYTVKIDCEKDAEDKVAYFREDVELNNLYYTWFLHYPNWLNTKKYGLHEVHKMGELFYYMHKQILARYLLERWANGESLEDLISLLSTDYEDPLKGYDPKLVDYNGKPLAVREDGMVSTLNESNFQSRLFSDLLLGVYHISDNETSFLTEDTLYDTIGAIYYGSLVPEYYGSWFDFGREQLSSIDSDKKGNSAKGAINYLLTSLRDPVYYNFLQSMVFPMNDLKSTDEPYELNEGFTVEIMDVSEMVTFFADFEFDATNAVFEVGPERVRDGRFKAVQKRLYFENFNYTLRLNTTYNLAAVVRVFLGPSSELMFADYNLTKHFIVEIDRFPVEFDNGSIIIERSSDYFSAFSGEQESSYIKYLRMKENLFVNDNETYHETIKYCGLPYRMVLPKGSENGTTFTLMVSISSLLQKNLHGRGLIDDRVKVFDNFIMCGGLKWDDEHSMGFPFDRPSNETNYPDEPYIDYRDVTIFHRE